MTLDGKHKEFISEFNRDETEVIPKLKTEIQLLKQLFPMEVIVSGKTTDNKEVHWLKVDAFISVSVFGKEMDCNNTHPSNALSPIKLILVCAKSIPNK